jgi:hypothetical protein
MATRKRWGCNRSWTRKDGMALFERAQKVYKNRCMEATSCGRDRGWDTVLAAHYTALASSASALEARKSQTGAVW